MSDIDDQTPVEGETPYQPSDIFPSEDVKTQCLEYVCSEILEIRDGQPRKGLEERWEKWRRQRRAIPESETRDTPWINAANVEPPLTQQKVNTIWAKMVSAFAGKKPPVQVEPLGATAGDAATAEALSKFLNHLVTNRYGLDWNRRWPGICYNNTSMGTAFVKVPFLMEQWSFKKKSADLGTVEDATFTKHQGPALIEVRLEDLFTRPHWKDLETAPWVAVRYRYFAHELMQKAAMGIFDAEAVLKILEDPSIELDDNRASELDRSGITADSISNNRTNSEYEIYEVNVFWDLDGTGVPVDLVLIVHPDSKTILRSQFNPLSVRDIEPVVYFDNPDVLYGIGVCEMCESSQDEVTTLHRMRLDGTQLAMQKVFFTRRGSGIGANETIEPMKVFQMDDPRADLVIADFPDIAPSCVTGEMIAKDYADRVTGASDYMQGFNDRTLGTSATASGTIFLANQANSILSAILARTQDSATNIVVKALYQCIANKDLVDLSWMNTEDAILVRSVFDMGVEQLPTKFRFSVQITDLMKTDEARRQNFLAANQVYLQYSQQMMQLASVMANPQVAQNPVMGELTKSLYVGFSKFMSRIIDFFDVGEPGDYLPFTQDMEFMLAVQDQLRNQQLQAVKGQISAQQTGTSDSLSGEVGGPGAAPAGPVAGGGEPGPMAQAGGGMQGGQVAGPPGAGGVA